MNQPFKLRDTLNLSELDPQFPSIEWTFWGAPPLNILLGLDAPYALRRLMAAGDVSDEQQRELYAQFFTSISEIVLDTHGTLGFDNKTPLDFSTPEKAQATLEDTAHIDTELISGIIMAYANRLIDKRNARQKKVAALLNSTPADSSSAAMG